MRVQAPRSFAEIKIVRKYDSVDHITDAQWTCGRVGGSGARWQCCCRSDHGDIRARETLRKGEMQGQTCKQLILQIINFITAREAFASRARYPQDRVARDHGAGAAAMPQRCAAEPARHERKRASAKETINSLLVACAVFGAHLRRKQRNLAELRCSQGTAWRVTTPTSYRAAMLVAPVAAHQR